MSIGQLWGIVGAVALAASAATAQDRDPDWVKRPSAQDLLSVWPGRALQAGYGGKATLSCIVTVQGTLRACQVVEEQPADGGFGGAALTLSPQFLMKPALKDGKPVEASVRIPIAFPRPERATGSYLKPSTATDLPGTKVYSRLPWRMAPSFTQVLAAYPAKARAAKTGGTAVLDCRITKDGGLSGCQTVQETPDGAGFGGAAKSLAPYFRTQTTDGRGGSIVGAHTQLNIAFSADALDRPVIGRPNWTTIPQMSDFTKVIPDAARKAAVYKARVVMLCDVGPEGELADCKVDAEEPANLGYADAALTLARHFRLAVWTEEGLPSIGGKVRVPLRFDLEAAMADKAQD